MNEPQLEWTASPLPWHVPALVEPTLTEVIDAVAATLRVSIGDLTGPSQVRPLGGYRQLAYGTCRVLTSASYPSIGKAFDRDHTTIVRQCRRLHADVARAALLDQLVAGVRTRLRCES